MLILLPPSEGKAAEGDGPAVDMASLTLPELTGPRLSVLDALGRLCRGPDDAAARVLGLPAGQVSAALARNRALREAPALPAARLYTGVLYDNLGLASLPAAGAAAAAADRILIFTGLWGVLRITDRVPPYRLAMGVALPPLGGLAAFWRPELTAALRPGGALRPHGGLLVDMRSAPYAAACRAGPDAVAVRVFRERVVEGRARRTVVSHMAKATRGAIARDLITADVRAETPEELLKAVSGLGHQAELNGANLDVVLP